MCFKYVRFFGIDFEFAIGNILKGNRVNMLITKYLSVQDKLIS